MKRRIIAVVTALAGAAVAAVLLMTYVAAADHRAMEGMRTVSVMVVTAPIAEGTSGDQLATLVESKSLPSMAVAPGAVTSLDEVAGLVATGSLQPGEQLLASRFASPASLADAKEVKVPKGMQQMSILLESQRVLGGTLSAHNTVGVLISMEEKDSRPPQTHLVLDKVLVSKVEGGSAAAPAEEGAPSSEVGKQNVLVTLVLSAPDAEKLVFGAEHGTVWLSLENDQSVKTGTRVVTPENVYK